MRILYLAHRVPYPPNKGDKIRSYHHVRYLAQRHDVHLLAFFDDPSDAQWITPLRELCREVVLIPLQKKHALARGLYVLAKGRSLSEGYFGSGAMRRAIERATAGGAFDVAWAFSSAMAQYLGAVEAPCKIADFVDVDSEKWLQFAQHSRAPRRWLYRLEAARLSEWERRVGEVADRVLFVSETEAASFRSFCPNGIAVEVVPNGVNTAYFVPPSQPYNAPPNLLFTGALDYSPNIDAVTYLAREVVPLVRREIPEARLIAVGHRPAAFLLREAEQHRDSLTIAGSVPDVRPYFAQARVYVAPLRLGRGVQNKILEAMAMGVPVVASSLAVAGLSAKPGTHVRVADGAAAFAAAVVSLLREPASCRRLAEDAMQLIRQEYDWSTNLRLLDACISWPAKSDRASVQPRWMACSA